MAPPRSHPAVGACHPRGGWRRAAATVLGLLALLTAQAARALEIAFTAVAPGVYAYVGDTEGRTYDNEALNANIGLIATPQGAILIDSGATVRTAATLAAAAQRATGQPVRWVINTGTQDHRWLGNGYFVRQGIPVYAHANGRADMQRRGPEQLSANAPVLKDKQAGTEVVLPTHWIDGDDTELTLGGVTLRLVHRGGGHTPGDMMVYVPAHGVVFTGDVVYVDRILGMHPVSRSRPWLATFEALEALQPRIVVPGHGRVTDLAQAQRDTGELLRALRAHMRRAVDEGVDLGTAVRTFDARPFAHLKHAEVWLPQLANRSYLEVEQE